MVVTWDIVRFSLNFDSNDCGLNIVFDVLRPLRRKGRAVPAGLGHLTTFPGTFVPGFLVPSLREWAFADSPRWL